MSHRPERKEKNCLNCGTTVAGKYCQHCGQENTEPGMSVWGLIQHFFYDISHFDGKYFDTLRLLFKRPGYLTSAFMQGKRASFVDPVKMYIFTSAFFFLLFYSFFLTVDEKDMESSFISMNELSDSIRKLDTSNNNYNFLNSRYLVLNKKDTLLDLTDAKAFRRFKDSVNQLLEQKKLTENFVEQKEKISISGIPEYSTSKGYDSLQQLLPESKRDSWLTRLINYRQITIREEYQGNMGKYFAHLSDRFLHSFPTILFISLPLLALLLNLLFIQRKEYLYVYHGIFLIHLYIFTFLLLIPFFLTYQAENYLKWKIWSLFRLGLFVWIVVYAYKSMREFYHQSKTKTILKLWLFLLLSLLCFIIIFVLYFAMIALKG